MVHLAQVPGHARGPQHRPRQAPVDRHLAADHAQSLDPFAEDRVVSNQFFVFIDLRAKPVAEVFALLQPAPGQVGRHPANAEVVVVDQALAGGRLPEVVDHLPLAEDIEEGGLGAHVGQERAQPQQVVGDAVQFQHQHADVAGPLRHRHIGQPFGRIHHDRLIEHARRIVHAAHVGHEHHVGAVLGNFFHAAVQVADHRLAIDHVLAIEGHHQPQHPVHRGVVGAEVDHHRLRARLQLRHGTGA